MHSDGPEVVEEEFILEALMPDLRHTGHHADTNNAAIEVTDDTGFEAVKNSRFVKS